MTGTNLLAHMKNLLTKVSHYHLDLSVFFDEPSATLDVSTDPTDEALFRELGLDLFNCHYMGEKVFVGEVKDYFEDDSWVKVWVKALPATFWTFEVYCHETGYTYNISTGSGPLNRYWDTIEKIADGMLVIDEIKEGKNDVTN